MRSFSSGHATRENAVNLAENANKSAYGSILQPRKKEQHLTNAFFSQGTVETVCVT